MSVAPPLTVMPSEFARRFHFQARVRVHLVEVLERGRQLSKNRWRIAQVHAAQVVAPEGIDEALSNAVALWAAHRCVDRLQAQRPGDALGVVSDVGAAVVREEFQRVIGRDCLDRAEALFNRLNEHLTHRLAWQPFALPCPPGHDLAIAAVLGEGGRDGLARVALDLEAVRAPAQIAGQDRHRSLVRPARLVAPRGARQQQAVARHHAVHALGIHARPIAQTARSIDQGACTPIAIAGQLSNLLTNVDHKLCIGGRRTAHSAIAPGRWPVPERMDVRARQPQCLTDGLHWSSSLGNKGERAIHFFSAAYSTASLRISFSKVFLPRMRCSLAISVRAAASSEAGTTASPADTAVNAPWRSSLRHWNSRLAATPS